MYFLDIYTCIDITFTFLMCTFLMYHVQSFLVAQNILKEVYTADIDRISSEISSGINMGVDVLVRGRGNEEGVYYDDDIHAKLTSLH